MRYPSVPSRLTGVLCAACLAISASLPAQVAPPQASVPATAGSNEVIELSPFEVRTDRDQGWVAGSTLASNRTNTDLIDVGASIDAVTGEFMRDLGVYRLEDVARFAANIDVVPDTGTSSDEGRLSFRGMQLGGRETAQSSRNFFAWFTPTDTFNIDRVDFSKGSNSLIYGDSIPGGMANSYTKRARFKDSGEVTARYDSFDSHRVQLDLNRRLNNKLAARLNVVDRDERSYLDYAHQSLRAIHGTATYRPFARTQVRFEIETGKFERIRGADSLSLRPNSAPGLGFSTANRWYVTSDGEIRYVTTANTSSTDRSAAGGTLVPLMEGQTATVNLMNRVGSSNVPSGQTLTMSGYPQETNLRGPVDFLNRPYTNYTGFLEQQFGKLNIELSFNRQDQEQQRTDGSFENTVSVDRNGRPYTDMTINKRTFGDHVRIVRAVASYPFEFGHWMRQFVVISAETQRDQLYNFRKTLANFAALANGPSNIANQQVVFRAYLDDPRFPGESFWNQFRTENLPQTNTFRAGWYDTTTTDLPFIDVRSSRAYSTSVAGRYFKDRLHTLIGVRYDKFDRKRITNLPTDEIGQTIYLGDDTAAPEAYAFDPTYNLHHTSYTGGLVCKITDTTSLYGTYAESFRWQPYEEFTGKPLGPVLGKTHEVGLKTALLDRRLFASIGVYRTDRSNTRYVWSPDDLTATEMENLFNPNNLRPGDPGYFLPAAGANDENRTVPAIERAQGVEATFQLQRMHGIQLRLALAHNELSTRRDFSTFRAYLDAAIARGDEDPTALADAQRILAANDGVVEVTGTRSAANSASWNVDYQFGRAGFLRGLRVALYGSWRGAYNLSLVDGIMYRGGPTHMVGAYIIHQRRIAGHSTSFRLGLANIVDLESNSKLRITGVRAADSNGVPTNYAYRYRTPFSADLSVTIGF